MLISTVKRQYVCSSKYYCTFSLTLAVESTASMPCRRWQWEVSEGIDIRKYSLFSKRLEITARKLDL